LHHGFFKRFLLPCIYSICFGSCITDVLHCIRTNICRRNLNGNLIITFYDPGMTWSKSFMCRTDNAQQGTFTSAVPEQLFLMVKHLDQLTNFVERTWIPLTVWLLQVLWEVINWTLQLFKFKGGGTIHLHFFSYWSFIYCTNICFKNGPLRIHWILHRLHATSVLIQNWNILKNWTALYFCRFLWKLEKQI